MSLLLEVSDLACGYHGCEVLEDVTFTLRAGERVVLLGSNGVGKSTLLKTIAKSLPPIRGEVRVGGDPVTHLSFGALARRIGTVPQEETTEFPFRVEEIVAMGRLAHSDGIWDSPEDRAATDEAMRLANCDRLRGRTINELSGGERQRVLIARAVAQGAPLLILDEPTAHLDVRHQIDVAGLVAELAVGGKGTLSAVHDLNLATALGERALLLMGRRLVLDGPIEDVLNSPLLDEAYRVRFHRTRDENGTLRVFGQSRL